eukprot:13326150-Alexandrium_andersonii.AAC.1
MCLRCAKPLLHMFWVVEGSADAHVFLPPSGKGGEAVDMQSGHQVLRSVLECGSGRVQVDQYSYSLDVDAKGHVQ